MRILRISILSFILALGLSSCAPKLTPFTEKLYKENDWSEAQLKKIQFYLSEEVVIYRALKKSSSAIVSGEIKMIDGRQVEEIRLPKGTPGIMEFMEDDKSKIAISFEEGADERYLMFGANPKQSGRYSLFGKDWKNKVGKVTYGGKVYRTAPGDGYACLMVNLKKINKTQVSSRKVKGRTL